MHSLDWYVWQLRAGHTLSLQSKASLSLWSTSGGMLTNCCGRTFVQRQFSKHVSHSDARHEFSFLVFVFSRSSGIIIKLDLYHIYISIHLQVDRFFWWNVSITLSLEISWCNFHRWGDLQERSCGAYSELRRPQWPALRRGFPGRQCCEKRNPSPNNGLVRWNMMLFTPDSESC